MTRITAASGRSVWAVAVVAWLEGAVSPDVKGQPADPPRGPSEAPDDPNASNAPDPREARHENSHVTPH